MLRNKFYLIAFVFLMQNLYAEEITRTNKTPHIKELNIVWHYPFHTDTGSAESFLTPLIVGDHVIFSSSFNTAPGKEQGFRVLHKITGENHPAWQHEPGGVVDSGDIINAIQRGGTAHPIIFAGNSSALYAIDLNSGKKLWKSEHSPNVGIPAFSMFGSEAFQNYNPPTGGLSNSWSRIGKCDMLSGEKVDLVELWMEEDYEFLVRPPAWTISDEDTLLLFLSSGWNFTESRGRINAYCYNITRRKMEWEKKNIYEGGSAGFQTPFIDDGKVFFQTISSVHCFNIATGKEIWVHAASLSDGYSLTPMIFEKGRIYLRSQQGIVTCLNASDGEILWENTTVKPVPVMLGNMGVYNGHIYLTGGKGQDVLLHCFSLENGDLEWSSHGPAGRISGGITIDKETGFIYCTSDWSVMCLKLH